MADVLQVAAFEGGELRLLHPEATVREAVLALPLSRLIVKTVRVPDESRDDPVAYATPILQAMSPYPDEPLAVGCETLRETASGMIVVAAALPESAADDICEALDAKALGVTRVDALAFGVLQGLWGRIAQDGARRLLLYGTGDCISLIVLEGDAMCAVRALSGEGDLRREITLSLLEAEDFCGAKPLSEVIAVGSVDASVAAAFAPVTRIEVGEDAALDGVAQRSADGHALDAMPASWRDVLHETRAKRKMAAWLCVAGAAWLASLAALFGVPAAYDWMASRQKDLCSAQKSRYDEVRAMKGKVELVRKYSDNAHGALETMRAVNACLPADGMTLRKWTYTRSDGVKFSGEAASPAEVMSLKDRLVDAVGDGEGAERAFAAVEMVGSVRNNSRNGRSSFEIECRFEGGEEDGQ